MPDLRPTTRDDPPEGRPGHRRPLIIAPDQGVPRERAEALAASLGAVLVQWPPPHPVASSTATGPPPLVLRVSPDGLSLIDTAEGKGGVLRIDCADLNRLCSHPDRKQPIARAVGLRPGLTVLDATAGLLGDSILLAALGCSIHAFERSPIIAALIEDALTRTAPFPRLAAVVRERLVFSPGDAGEALRSLAAQTGPTNPDVVYLDPMHPPRRKAALVKKEMRLVRAAVGDDPDAGGLLALALAAARRRVVVKQPRLAPPLLPDRPPEATIVGRSVRYEIYSAARLHGGAERPRSPVP